jgi:hypothetical protein
VATFGEVDVDVAGLTARIFDGEDSLLATERLRPD